MIRSLISAALVAVMVVACGQEDTPKPPPAPATATPPPASPPATTPPAGTAGAPADPAKPEEKKQ